MKVHEYQAKDLLRKYGLPVQEGYTLEREEDIYSVLDRVEADFGASSFVVKAQVHAGGRGKGGGVKYAKDRSTAEQYARSILGMRLVTPQTGEKGTLVRTVMITEALDIEKEYYVAITLDRKAERHVIVVCREGGVDIEELAEKSPEAIQREWVHDLVGLQRYQSDRLARALALERDMWGEWHRIISGMYLCYLEAEANLLEVNPLILSKEGRLVLLDAKMILDDNALFRHQDLFALRDIREEDTKEVEASRYGLNFIKLEGNVGCMVNGAGLAMATMDIIRLKGGVPANFLDVGGSANEEAVKNAFRIILSDVSVRSILINIFGGIVRCDRVARGVVEAMKEMQIDLPVIIRLAGTNVDMAREYLASCGVSVTYADSLEEAAEKAVLMSKQAV